MTPTFVDANVLVDLLSSDPTWADWSQARLGEAASRGSVWMSDVTYAEVAVGYARTEDADAALATLGVEVVRTPRAALFLAGRAYRRYRQSGGTRTGVLPDFFIGAHAAVEGVPLLTRDVSRYRSYFPDLSLLHP